MRLAFPIFAALVALSVAACGSGSDGGDANGASAPSPAASATAGTGETETATAEPEPTRALKPITDEDLVGLVYWQEIDFWNGYQGLLRTPPESALDTVLAMALDEDNAYLQYLIDFAMVPVPYSAFAYELLLSTQPPTEFPILGWVEGLGFRTPADDSATYLAFKHKLIRGIQEQMGAFVDPAQPRTISAQEVVWGGVRVDGIPPLESPHFLSAREAVWIGPDDLVIGVEINGDARAYPRRIVDWHEMVNDTVGGVPVSLAYCTLCGSAILYDGRVGDGVYRFGTSGLLYRSNKLMYDRTTNTLWEQFTGEPVWGELVGSGIQLKFLPVVHTTYETWLKAHPDTLVLDIDTGHNRNYGEGVAYARYFRSSQLMFPAPDRSGPPAVKSPVYAVRLNGEVLAYPISLLRDEGFLHDDLGDVRLVVFATADGTGGRAFAAGDEEFVEFDPESGIAVTAAGTSWTVSESALVSDAGAELERLPGHNSFWFAVSNHSPSYRLYELPSS